MSLIRQRRKKIIKVGALGAVLGILFFSVVIAIVFLWRYRNANNEVKENKKYALEKPLKEVKIHKITEPFKKDMRLMNYEFIQITEKLTKGDYIDVRISFANGADFIVLSKKKIEDISASKALWLTVTEEELLRVSSAAVDAYLNEGCSVYAIEYLSAQQEEATVNYPVNEVVDKLIGEDPNIIAKAKNVLVSMLRSELELQKNSIGSKKEYIASQEDTVQDEYYSQEQSENEQIEYLD